MSQNETSGTVAVDNQKIRTKQMVLIALMTAVTCVLGPLSIPLPFSPVPIPLQTLQSSLQSSFSE